MKPKRKILSLLLVICLVAGLLPTTAFALDGDKAIMLGTSGISGFDTAKGGTGYDYIYFGDWDAQDGNTTSSPIKWRVLDDQTNTGETGLFLLSDVLLGTGSDGGVYFGSSNVWQNSTAQEWCEAFYSDNLTTQEQGAFLATTKSDGAFTSSTYRVPFAASENILNGDKVFFLSAEEAENSAYGFTDDNARIANYGNRAGVWWLRSPYAYYSLDAGAVYDYGYVYNYNVSDDWAARPAFNLNRNSVLFTSAAVGGKPDDGLQAVPSQTRADRIVGQWDFNDTSDSSGNGNTLTTNGFVSFNGGRMETQEGLIGNASVNLKLSGEAGFSLSLAFSTMRAAGTGAGAQTELFQFGSLTAVADITGELEVTLDGQSVGSAVGAVSDGGTNTLEVRIETDNALHVILNGADIGSIADANVGGEGTLVIGNRSNLGYATSFDDVKIKYSSINECKLTLLDDSRNFNVTETTASGDPGDTITLHYTGATIGTNEYISVIIADSSGAQYYGRIAQPTNANGTVSLEIPDTLADGIYTLNVFSEQYNGGENDDTKLTDYASAFEAVTLTVSSDTTALTLSNGNATRDSDTSATVKFTSSEAGTCYYIAQDTEITLTKEQIAERGTQQACKAGENEIELDSITASAQYVAVVAQDAAGNISDVLKISIPAYIAPSYGISASPVTLDFGSKTVDYTQAPAAQTVTLTNTGNQNVTVNLPTSTNYTVTAGEGFANDTATLALNGTAAFTVQPKIGLAIGTYSETLTIAGTNQTEASLTANFTVVPRNSGGSGGGGGHTTTSNPQYAITMLETENGSIRVSPERAKAGDRVKVTATPQAGYALDSLTVTDADGKTLTLNYMQTNVYTFEMPKGEVEISAVFAPATAQPAQPTLSFIDVQPNHWFYEAVCYVVENGLMHGMSDDTFSPNTPLQREMLAVILWNLAGNPEPKNAAAFSDVTSSQYYAKAIAWASENGIVSGYGDTFGVGDSITREQFALMLYRYAQYKGYDTTQGGMAVREFSDYAEISDYAKTALTWAVNTGIINGMGDGTLSPQGQATRAEAATMLMQFCEQVVK